MRPQFYKGVETRSSVRYDYRTRNYGKSDRETKLERSAKVCSWGHKHCFEAQGMRPRALKLYKAKIHAQNPGNRIIPNDIVI
jgi:hypothetical protein